MYNKKEMIDGIMGVVDIMYEGKSQKEVAQKAKLKKRLKDLEEKEKKREQQQENEISRG